MKKHHLLLTMLSVIMVSTSTLTSCGDFGTGLLYGMASAASRSGSGYGYLTNPGYTAAQTGFSAPSFVGSDPWANTVIDTSSSSSYSGSNSYSSTSDSSKKIKDRSSSSSSSSSTQNKRKCAYCKNGRVVKYYSVPTFGLDDPKVRCEECGETYYRSKGHCHVDCRHCGGTGYAK